MLLNTPYNSYVANNDESLMTNIFFWKHCLALLRFNQSRQLSLPSIIISDQMQSASPFASFTTGAHVLTIYQAAR